jgi:hypothetical protein
LIKPALDGPTVTFDGVFVGVVGVLLPPPQAYRVDKARATAALRILNLLGL